MRKTVRNIRHNRANTTSVPQYRATIWHAESDLTRPAMCIVCTNTSVNDVIVVVYYAVRCPSDEHYPVNNSRIVQAGVVFHIHDILFSEI